MWGRTFRFQQGRATHRFVINAPDPPLHTWTVRVVQPRDGDVMVGIRTWYGNDFHVFDSTAGAEASSCHPTDGALECVALFPALEAQRPGKWTVLVKKLSNPPAEVQVQVEFAPLDEQQAEG